MLGLTATTSFAIKDSARRDGGAVIAFRARWCRIPAFRSAISPENRSEVPAGYGRDLVASGSVPVRAGPSGEPLLDAGIGDQGAPEFADHRTWADKPSEASCDRLWPLGGVANDEKGALQHGALLLDPAGVRDDQPREAAEGEETAVTGWRAHDQPIERGGQAVPLSGEPGTGMQREQDRQAQLGQLVPDGLKPVPGVTVLRPGEGGDDLSAW